MLQHYDSWVTYMNDTLGHDTKKGELTLVIGTVKSRADWTIAAFCNIHTKKSMSLGVQAMSFASTKGHLSRATSVTGLRMRREGHLYIKPSPESASPEQDVSSAATSPASDVINQCISTKRCKIRRRFGIVRHVVAGAGYHHLPEQDEERRAAGGEGIFAEENEGAEGVWLDMESKVSARSQCTRSSSEVFLC